MDYEPMITNGYTPLTEYKGTFEQVTILDLNGGQFSAPVLTPEEKKFVKFHRPNVIFPERNPDQIPYPQPCPIAEAYLINDIEYALAQPRTYTELGFELSEKHEHAIRRWITAYHRPESAQELLRPYERLGRPVSKHSKSYKVAMESLQTYAAENRYLYSGYFASIFKLEEMAFTRPQLPFKGASEWFAQKLAKCIDWHSPQLDFLHLETADDMAERWAAGNANQAELDEMDEYDQRNQDEDEEHVGAGFSALTENLMNEFLASQSATASFTSEAHSINEENMEEIMTDYTTYTDDETITDYVNGEQFFNDCASLAGFSDLEEDAKDRFVESHFASNCAADGTRMAEAEALKEAMTDYAEYSDEDENVNDGDDEAGLFLLEDSETDVTEASAILLNNCEDHEGKDEDESAY